MTDQHETDEAITEETTTDEAITDETAEDEPEVEGFGGINTTRSNIKHAGSVAAPAPAPAFGGIGSGKSDYAIKEQGIK